MWQKAAEKKLLARARLLSSDSVNTRAVIGYPRNRGIIVTGQRDFEEEPATRLMNVLMAVTAYPTSELYILFDPVAFGLRHRS